MMLAFVLACTVITELSNEQRELLRIFRAEFVEITPGMGTFPARFSMGSENGSTAERPVREVTLSHSFSVAKYEVTQNLWTAVMGNNPSKWKGPRNSVEMLTFADAQEFCRRATELMREAKLIAADQVIRLPTEAEWEYVARAGTRTKYSFGDNREDLGKYAWSTENAAGNDPPVGAKLPNPWGLYDIHGYLREWCQDPWHADYVGAPADSSAWLPGADDRQGVVRGGSWKDSAEKLTSSYRQAFSRGGTDDAVGLRCVLSGLANRSPRRNSRPRNPPCDP